MLNKLYKKFKKDVALKWTLKSRVEIKKHSTFLFIKNLNIWYNGKKCVAENDKLKIK